MTVIIASFTSFGDRMKRSGSCLVKSTQVLVCRTRVVEDILSLSIVNVCNRLTVKKLKINDHIHKASQITRDVSGNFRIFSHLTQFDSDDRLDRLTFLFNFKSSESCHYRDCPALKWESATFYYVSQCTERCNKEWLILILTNIVFQ